MFDGIAEAQKRLEEKRAELQKQTPPTPIGSERVQDLDLTFTCCACGKTDTLDAWWFEVGFYKVSEIDKHKAEGRCQECREREGREYEENRKREEAEFQEKIRQSAIRRQLETCGIPERFRNLTFEDYRPSCKQAEDALKTCRTFAETFEKESGKSLMLIGSCGTGKSMLTAATGQDIIKRGFTFTYTTAMKIVRDIKATWNDREATEQKAINSFISPDCLAIEEIGVQFGSATEQLYLTEIVNERYERMKSTILISNLTIPQLEDCIGKRAVDRMYEDGKVLVFNWPSYRRRP